MGAQNLNLMNADAMHVNANKIWNRLGRVPVHKSLAYGPLDETSKSRLTALGNVVMPPCARLAMHVLGHFVR